MGRKGGGGGGGEVQCVKKGKEEAMVIDRCSEGRRGSVSTHGH